MGGRTGNHLVDIMPPCAYVGSLGIPNPLFNRKTQRTERENKGRRLKTTTFWVLFGVGNFTYSKHAVSTQHVRQKHATRRLHGVMVGRLRET